MSGDRNIRDPIHGFISIQGRETDVLDCLLFQRLRKIRQLAMAYLVYPGALHTRFDHTLGVLHIAGQLCKQLDVDSSHSRIVRLAALLHDIGHGPFSHVSESILTEVSGDRIEVKAGKKEKIHEMITQAIILQHKYLDHGLSKRDREEVVQLLSEGLDHKLYRDIISGPLDADKQDYLLRDSYFCGVNYGIYDLAQLHNTLSRQRDGEEAVMVVEESGVHSLEQFVLAKYYLTTQVYRHKVRLIADHMLIRAMLLGVKLDKLKFLIDLYQYPENAKDLDKYLLNYLVWDDERTSLELLKEENAKTEAGKMFRRLNERRLFKRIINIKTHELRSPLPAALSERFADTRQGFEAEIAEKLSSVTGTIVSPSEVILNLYKIESVRKQARNDETGVLIRKNTKLVQMEEASVLFKSINEGLRDEFLDCYAPLPDCDEKRRREYKSKMEEWFLSRLGEHFDKQIPLLPKNPNESQTAFDNPAST